MTDDTTSAPPQGNGQAAAMPAAAPAPKAPAPSSAAKADPAGCYLLLEPVLERFAGHVVRLTPEQARSAAKSVRPATRADLAAFGRAPADLTPKS